MQLVGSAQRSTRVEVLLAHGRKEAAPWDVKFERQAELALLKTMGVEGTKRVFWDMGMGARSGGGVFVDVEYSVKGRESER